MTTNNKPINFQSQYSFNNDNRFTLYTFQTLPQFKILASTATYLERVFVGVFTATRFLAILTAGIVHPAAGIFISLFIVFVGSLVLVFTQQISAAAVWAGVILQAVNIKSPLS